MSPGRRSRSTRQTLPPQLTLWDRLVFGCLTALVGAGLGIAIALILMLTLDGYGFSVAISGFSTAYFFAVGYIRGPSAGEFAGEAIAYGASAVAAAGDAELDPATGARTGGASHFWWWVVYVVVVVALAWMH